MAPPGAAPGAARALTAIEASAAGVRLLLLVQPRAARTEVAGWHDGRVRLRLAAPPVEGAANEALMRFLAKALGVPRGAVRLVAGQRGRRKTVHVDGIGPTEAAAALGLSEPPRLPQRKKRLH